MNSQTKRNITLANAIQRIDDHMFLAAETRAWAEMWWKSRNKRDLIVTQLLNARLLEVLGIQKEIILEPSRGSMGIFTDYEYCESDDEHRGRRFS